MARISDETRRNNEMAIRQVMERLLAGDVPAGGKCDVKALATQAGVARTGFYPKKNRDGSPRPGPYQHLAEEFERRLAGLRETGVIPDPRAAQVERLKEQVFGLKERLAERDAQIGGLTDFQERALSQIAAQRMEIERLRDVLAGPSNVRALPSSSGARAPYGSCS
ncbi:hypothetical protein OTB20_29455 [Streptomyces sp. H27-H1]|uniref:hypothetical protein n=1 Tax=Streptomyces sp. H27-H1 TaxID=2996461 RepID=UPI00226FF41F|nr:hypothetical protein [Streptomyces sp. H27-H1]MCY0930242.1 hypothetical protein [Streptomyces sp. H27-H1]